MYGADQERLPFESVEISRRVARHANHCTSGEESMLKKHMAACLVATAFAAAPAFAQTQPSGSTDRPTASGSGSTSTGSSAMQPSMSTPSTGSASSMGSSSMSQSSASQGQFMTQMQSNQMMASDLIGTRVVSANNESIGDINDVIVDRNGQAVAAVVGVGGFLGIGEKDVAVPFNSLEFASAQQVSAMDNRNSNNANAPATTGSTASGTTANTNTIMGASSTTGTTGSTASSSGNANEPERVVLRMTKAELQAAPTFNKDGNNSGSATSGSSSTAPASGTSTAPKP
jgi:sporulation protein YlmC with PRC-barrel domain